jgi:hypothetical protein
MGAVPIYQGAMGPDVKPAGETDEYLSPTIHIDKAFQKEQSLRARVLSLLHYEILSYTKIGTSNLVPVEDLDA